MEAITMSPSPVSSHHLDAASTSEDMSLQEGLLFSDSLKDLRNLRSQLYSAADYFEVFYRNNSHKSTVMTSLKDYTVEALVSTVDHLGFVSYKVDNLVNEKADEVNEAEFRVSSVEQVTNPKQIIKERRERSMTVGKDSGTSVAIAFVVAVSIAAVVEEEQGGCGAAQEEEEQGGSARSARGREARRRCSAREVRERWRHCERVGRRLRRRRLRSEGGHLGPVGPVMTSPWPHLPFFNFFYVTELGSSVSVCSIIARPCIPTSDSRTPSSDSRTKERVRICKQTIDQEGRSQQSLLIRAPKYHRRYILPGADIVEPAIHPVSEPPRYNRQYTSRKMHKSRSTISPPVCRQTTMRSVRSPSPTTCETHDQSRSLSPSRKARAKSTSPQIVNSNTKETRAGSPIPISNPLARSATVARRPPVNPKHLRQTSMQLDWDNHKELEKSSSKGRGFLKSLLTRRRCRNDESLYSYLDEY